MRPVSFLTRSVSAIAMLALPALATDLPEPVGAPLLTVTGEIAQRNLGQAAVFDLHMLESLETHGFTTTTIWTSGVQEFHGAPLSAVLERAGANGSRIRATAVNDYSIEITLSDDPAQMPLLAYRRNGSLMSVRNKGPLWLVYPYDSGPEFRTEQIYAQSIWQVDRIEVLN